MKKLSEYRGEQALDLLADLIEPCADIFSDKEFRSLATNKESLKAAVYVLRNKKNSALSVLATLNETTVDKYDGTLQDMVETLAEALKDPMLKEFFTSQGQTEDETVSGSATENTGDGD